MNTARALPSRIRPRIRLRTLAKAATAITLAFAAFMVLVHVPFGRRLLAPLFGDKCPMTPITAQQAEAARVAAARLTAGTGVAPVRPALGFELEKTTPDDVRAWAKKTGVTCSEERGGALLKCKQVPAAAVSPALPGPALSEIVLAFEPTRMTLVNLTAYVSDVSEEVGAARASAARDALRAALGPGAETGELTAEALTKLRAASVTYRFANYQAEVSATQLDTRRVMVREHYMAGVR